MPARSAEVRRSHARRAATARWGDESQSAALDHRETRLADHIQREVDSWPPFTPEQRDRLALILRPAAGGAAR